MLEIRDIHRPFLAFLAGQPVVTIYQRSDRETSGEPGQPDFIIARGGIEPLCIEAKNEKRKPSKDQLDWHASALKVGIKVHVCRSITECVEVFKGWMTGLGEGAAVPRSLSSSPSYQLCRHQNSVWRKHADGSIDHVRPANQLDNCLPPLFAINEVRG